LQAEKSIKDLQDSVIYLTLYNTFTRLISDKSKLWE